MMLSRPGLGQAVLPPTMTPLWAIPSLVGQEQLDWARGLVTPEFCALLDCGVYTQSEVGLARQFACGLAYPGRPQSPCGPVCEPYREMYENKWGPVCGATPQSEPPPAVPPPAYVPPEPELVFAPPPAAIQAPVTVEDVVPVTLLPIPQKVWPIPEPKKPIRPCCVLELGPGCCLTMDQAIGIGLVFVALLVTRN